MKRISAVEPRLVCRPCTGSEAAPAWSFSQYSRRVGHEMRVGAGADGQVGWVQLLRVTGTKRALERDRPMKFLDAHVALDAGLCSGEVLWRPKPFHTPRVPWRTTHAVLFRDLLRLSETELQTLQRDRVALHDFIAVREPSFSNVASISRQLEILATSISAPTSAVGGSRDHIGIPGKKWTQIEAFASAVPRSVML